MDPRFSRVKVVSKPISCKFKLKGSTSGRKNKIQLISSVGNTLKDTISITLLLKREALAGNLTKKRGRYAIIYSPLMMLHILLRDATISRLIAKFELRSDLRMKSVDWDAVSVAYFS